MSESSSEYTKQSEFKRPLLEVESADVKTPALYLRSLRKRVIDVVISLIGILITLIVFIPVSLVIKLNSRGPILYRQRRIGVDHKPFYIVKFRSMKTDAESDGVAKWAQENDDRATWSGKLMRSTYIDELPQSWNVLKGDMSIVGPRPERPELETEIVAKLPDFEKRTAAKPGITGLAQIHYRYGRDYNDARIKLKYDRRYIENASMRLDLSIIVGTILHVFSRPGS
jgi:lipopolysaccharide/colanic/teichoic acid biosynthesis glycosyltransferase